MLEKLRLLYGDQAETVLSRIDALADRYSRLRERPRRPLWDERSVVLITYGDQIRQEGLAALEAQRRLLLDFDLNSVINAIHILPFFPYSSDDGFSVIDYCRVDPQVGDWSDVARLGESFGLAFDFVLNHCSQRHAWFQGYREGKEPYTRYFIDLDPSIDLTSVTRPRSTPLLTPYETSRGTKYVWTTFSADQVDLNLENPDVLLEALHILLLYIQNGATVIRLDAIGFLWKRVGTTCLHLPETHAIVKLMRDLADDLAPGTILLTETNVPHAENISYFGAGDEAHAVYQFSLAPLLLDAFLNGDAGPLNAWLTNLEFPGDQMTFLNFTASHDGVGVRPLEGLVAQDRVDALVAATRQRGGRVSMRRNPDGSESPYELNISYLSALNSPAGLPPDRLARKFLTSQGLMVSLRGIPGVYFHSLVGTQNYDQGVAQTGHNRSINRRKFESDELRQVLADSGSLERKVFDGYHHMLAVRIAQPGFHPDAEQTSLACDVPSLVAFTRTSQDGRQRILVTANLGGEPVALDLAKLVEFPVREDLLSGRLVQNREYVLAPYDIAWLA
jgi:sucrose phosphorylase